MNQEFKGRVSAQQRTTILISILVLGSICWLNTGISAEVYTWTDQAGVVHFSDLPPLTENARVMEVEDVYRPGSSGAYPAAEGTTAAPSVEDDNPMTENPATLAQQRRAQLAKDREARKEKMAETAEMCKKYEQLLARLEPARRVFYTNEQGEQVRMDDNERVERITESKDYIAKNCK